jgi:hypothetical protein
MPQRMQTRPPRHPIMQPSPPITRRHQILQRPTTNRLTTPIPQQHRRPPQPTPRKPHPTRLHIPSHDVRHRRLHRNRPIPTALTPHMQPLLTPPPHQRPHRQRSHLRRPQPSHQPQRDHHQIPLRPRIPRRRHPTTHHSRQQPLRSVLTPQRLGRQGSRPRPSHRRHRITRQHPLSHTERQELIPRGPGPGHRTTRMPIREHPERGPQHRRGQIRHAHVPHRTPHLHRHQLEDPSQIPLISDSGMRRVLPRPPSREEHQPRVRDQHHAQLIAHRSDTPKPVSRPKRGEGPGTNLQGPGDTACAPTRKAEPTRATSRTPTAPVQHRLNFMDNQHYP